MTPPTGLRSESTRTPNASRAGALHSHSHIHSQRHGAGPKAPSMTSGRGWPGSDLEHRPAVSASVMDGRFAATDTVAEVDLGDLDALDGLHHAWCGRCYPQWAARPLGAELGVPFIAWCGQRAVFLAVWQSHNLPPGEVCAGCWVEPIAPCATCGLVA